MGTRLHQFRLPPERLGRVIQSVAAFEEAEATFCEPHNSVGLEKSRDELYFAFDPHHRQTGWMYTSEEES